MPHTRALRVLDAGCGYHAHCLRAIGGRLVEGVGIDYDVSGEARRDPRLSFITSPLEQALPCIAAASFDVVLCISILEHLSDPLDALVNCRRILTPEGLLLVNVPTWYAKPLLEFSAFRLHLSPAVDMDEHKMYYNKRDLWPLLVRAGFQPSRIHLHYRALGMILLGAASRT